MRQRATALLGLEDAPARQMLLLLLAGDALFLFLHGVHGLAVSGIGVPGVMEPFQPAAFSIRHDGGYGEVFQYMKEYWIFGLLAWLAFHCRDLHLAAWSAVFAFLLADDWLEIHESAGASLAANFYLPHPAGLREQDLGELAFTSAVGLVLLPLLALSYLRASGPIRAISHRLAVLLALLAWFGVAVDVLHEFTRGTLLFHPLGVVEDGGEMIVMSFICAYAVYEARTARTKAARPLSVATTEAG